MSIYRNLNKVVSSQLFIKPNNFLLQSRFRPVYLEVNGDPRIEFVHSLKPLLKTIEEFEQLSGSQTSYAKLIEEELAFLNKRKDEYSEKVNSYVSKGGLLTGEGIANLYYSADRLKLSAEWLEQNIHHEVPKKFRFMSKSNLEDTIAGLSKYHKESPYLQQVKDELATRSAEKPTYVVHQLNETSKFEYGDNDLSNNVLLSSIKSNSGVWKYYIQAQLSQIANRGRYLLHSA